MQNLPPHIREVYFAASTADEIYKAAQESGVSEDLMFKAGFLLGDVLLGILDPKEFSQELVNSGAPEPVAASFYRLITQSILFKIKSELDQMYAPLPTETKRPIELKIEAEKSIPPAPQPQPEEAITRIKIEPPPIRKIGAHNFKEEGVILESIKPVLEEKNIATQTPQPKINDPYREPVEGADNI